MNGSTQPSYLHSLWGIMRIGDLSMRWDRHDGSYHGRQDNRDVQFTPPPNPDSPPWMPHVSAQDMKLFEQGITTPEVRFRMMRNAQLSA